MRAPPRREAIPIADYRRALGRREEKSRANKNFRETQRSRGSANRENAEAASSSVTELTIFLAFLALTGVFLIAYWNIFRSEI